MIAALALTASALVTTRSAPPAAASPCGNGGTGSSQLGSSGSSTGSLGSSGSNGLGSSNVPNWGPQGPLVPFVNVSTRAVGWVTGPLSVNRTFSRFGISGTDLGISWDNGSGQTLMAFGDTFGNCNTGGQQWRHNVLLRTDDDRLADGMFRMGLRATFIRVPSSRPVNRTSRRN